MFLWIAPKDDICYNLHSKDLLLLHGLAKFAHSAHACIRFRASPRTLSAHPPPSSILSDPRLRRSQVGEASFRRHESFRPIAPMSDATKVDRAQPDSATAEGRRTRSCTKHPQYASKQGRNALTCERLRISTTRF